LFWCSLDVNEAARLLRKSIIYIEADDVFLEQDEDDIKEEVLSICSFSVLYCFS
jgi:hypothetical protein